MRSTNSSLANGTVTILQVSQHFFCKIFDVTEFFL